MGCVDGCGKVEARTWASVNLGEGTLLTDGAVVTITTLESAGAKTVTVN